MKAEKTRHCLRQTEGHILGYKTEMSSPSVGLAHIKASEKELSKIEAKWNEAQADLELAQAVKAWFVNENGCHTHLTKSIGDETKVIKSIKQLLNWYREQKRG